MDYGSVKEQHDYVESIKLKVPVTKSKLSPEAQRLFDLDMEIINYEVARENIYAVKGQYISEKYKEEEKEDCNKEYINNLTLKMRELRRIINSMSTLNSEEVNKLKWKFGNTYKYNEKLKSNGKRLL